MKLLLIAPTLVLRDANLDATKIGFSLFSAPTAAIHRLQQYVERNSDHQVDLFDSFVDGPLDPAKFADYDVIGFSITNYTLPDDLKLMVKAKEVNPSCVLIAGGVSATLDFNTVLRKTQADFVVLGYGEKQLLAIMNGETNIPGTIHRKFMDAVTQDEFADYYLNMDFGRLRYPEYWAKIEDTYKVPNYDAIRTVRLITSSHCNRQCSFCSVRSWAEMATGKFCKATILSADQLIQLTKNIQKQVPSTRSLYFTEDDFMVDMQRAFDYMEFSKNNNLNLLIQTHSSKVKKRETLVKLAEGKVKGITLGIESVIPRILKTMNKTNELELLPSIVEWCLELGISPHILIILFCQDITIPELHETIRLLRKYRAMGADVTINPSLYPYPGAALFDSVYEAEQEVFDLGNNLMLKKENFVLCNDPIVRKVQLRFRNELDAYIDANADPDRDPSTTKNVICNLQLDLLEKIIGEVDA